MASGREVSLSLRLWFIAKIQAGGTLDSAVRGIWRFCIRCLSALPTSVDTRQDPREALLMAFVLSLPAILWRSVTIFLMMGCWHPERMWSALSWQEQMGQLRLLECLKRTACFWLKIVPDRYLITVSFPWWEMPGIDQKALLILLWALLFWLNSGSRCSSWYQFVRCLVCGLYACVLVARRVCWGGCAYGVGKVGIDYRCQ